MRLTVAAEQEPTRQRLARLPRPVRLLVFACGAGCAPCRETEQLVHEIADVVSEVQMVGEGDAAAIHGVDQRPALAVRAPDVSAV